MHFPPQCTIPLLYFLLIVIWLKLRRYSVIMQSCILKTIDPQWPVACSLFQLCRWSPHWGCQQQTYNWPQSKAPNPFLHITFLYQPWPINSGYPRGARPWTRLWALPFCCVMPDKDYFQPAAVCLHFPTNKVFYNYIWLRILLPFVYYYVELWYWR